MSYVSELTDNELITKLISEASSVATAKPNVFAETGMRWNERGRLNELEAEARERFRVLRGGTPSHPLARAPISGIKR